MEIIKRTISKSEIKNKSNNNMPAYDKGELKMQQGYEPYSNWGLYPCDVVIKDRKGRFSKFINALNYYSDFDLRDIINLKSTLPLTEYMIDTSKYGEPKLRDGLILRYEVLRRNNKFMNRFLNECVFYTLCYRNGEYVFGKYATADPISTIDDCVLFDTIPNVSSIDKTTYAKFIQINPLREELYYGDMVIISHVVESMKVKDCLKAWNGNEWKTVICVHPEATKFRNMFIVNGANYTKLFYEFSNLALASGSTIITGGFSQPYVSVPVHLDATIDDLGIFRSDVEEWIPSKKYYIGDRVVYYDGIDSLGAIYKLKKGDKTEKIEIPESIYTPMKLDWKTSKNMSKEYDSDGNPHYYETVEYYTGWLNPITLGVEFDSAIGTHWVKCQNNADDSVKSVIIETTDKSRLNEVIRFKRSYDDNGEVLPFIVCSGETRFTELTFVPGVVSVSYNETMGKYVENILNSITIRCSSAITTSYTISYQEGSDDMTTFSLNDPITKEQLESCDMIEFDYTLDKVQDDNGSGIRYREAYKYTIDQYYCEYNNRYMWVPVKAENILGKYIDTGILHKPSSADVGKIYRYLGKSITLIDRQDGTKIRYAKGKFYQAAALFYYVNIKFDTSYYYKNDMYYTFDNDSRDVGELYSNVTFRNGEYTNRPYKMENFYDESLAGYTNITYDVDGHITRDKSGSAQFERRNILSEVNTMSDLENYKNNYFSL